MISYNEALKVILTEGARKTLASESIPVEKVVGRVLAEDVKAPLANQPFDNSAMDGFALQAAEVSGATASNPVELAMIGHIAAGEKAPSKAPGHKQCYEIMTGAPLPPGCDTVVPVEKTSKKGASTILFTSPAGKDENIRRAGADFKEGERLFSKGDVLSSAHVLVLATAGIGQVTVLKKPRIGVISTGLEVVDDLNADLAPGQIYNSTGPYLQAVLPEFGVVPDFLGTVPDQPALYKDKMLKAVAKGCDVVISTGAVSAGVHDFVPSVLIDMGAEILFHKAAIRPGKPILFAKLPDNGPLVVGLPGNPVSSAAGLRFFVYPLIRALQGQVPEAPLKAIARNSYIKRRAPLRFFLRGVLHHTGKTTHEVEIPDAQQSFMVAPFIKGNVWAVAPEGTEAIKKGDVIDVYPLRPLLDQSQI